MFKWKYKPCGICPVQAEGWFLGFYFYFRARGSYVTIDFSKTEERWVEGNNRKSFVLLQLDWPEAGYLSFWKSRLLVYWGCLLFLLTFSFLPEQP